MLTTAIFSAFSDRPAAFTRSIATGELRGRLGFEGVTITDALLIVAARISAAPARTGIAAARAGADLLLYPDPAAAHLAHGALARGLGSACPLPHGSSRARSNASFAFATGCGG